MKAAIYTQKNDLETFLYLGKFIAELQKKGVESTLYSKMVQDMEFSKEFQTFSHKQDLLDQNVHLFFTFGGDGTLVTSLLFVQDTEIPIIGVNTGRLGFLASFTKEEIFDELNDIINRNFKISKRAVIEVSSPDAELCSAAESYALNDISISRKETTSMITVESYIDGEFLNYFWGDGVIISTPTGSTAYSLSCGGPIISPETENFVITPIAPHNLNVRPLIVNDNVEIRLKVESRVPEYFLSLDSRLIHMSTGSEIIIRKAKFKISLVQPKKISFFETIRQKLLWGKDKRN